MPAGISSYGFKPTTMSGAGSVIRSRLCFVPATDATILGIGDPVIYTGASDPGGVPIVTKAAAGGGAFISGVIESVLPVTADSAVYRPASEGRYVRVNDHEAQEFQIRSSAALGVADVNANADITLGTVNLFTGFSGASINQATLGTTNTLQLRIIELVKDAGDPDGVFWSAIVKINLHTNRNLTGI